MIHHAQDSDTTIALLRATAQAAAEKHLAPVAAASDETATLPIDALKGLCADGLGGIVISELNGGAGLGRLASIAAFEELGRVDPSTAAFLSIHGLLAWALDNYGTPQQQADYMPALLDFSMIGAYALTEPGHGSDAANLRTTARRDGGDYILNGTKAFTSGGGVSDMTLLFARTGEGGPRGISAFLVPKDARGLSFGAQERKMGWRSQPTAMVVMDDCRIPADNLIGAEHKGFPIAMRALDSGRLNISSISLGAAMQACDSTITYMQNRTQFGQKLADFQALQFRMAEMGIALFACRAALEKAAIAVDAGSAEATVFVAAAKAFVTENAYQTIDMALQLHGGYGYLRDFPIERLLRDTRVHRILEGTNEIMRVLVARNLLATQ
ncbi:MAG: acyl-CoA dehydrogenase family protein [Alphaproteobacteria bacterium]|nr:acyl-CoA dehydrogenase family protein [Alphaproteobacteria bacterium]